ncbi:hypothetical protein DN34_3297 [Vibrio cholerae]|nr:hypothetical protein DN34_3297 [Vibrio cholerae]
MFLATFAISAESVIASRRLEPFSGETAPHPRRCLVANRPLMHYENAPFVGLVHALRLRWRVRGFCIDPPRDQYGSAVPKAFAAWRARQRGSSLRTSPS